MSMTPQEEIKWLEGMVKTCQEEITRLRGRIVELEADAHNRVKLVKRIEELEAVLREIERFGHAEGHGRGYTCANMAQKAMEGEE